MRRAAIVLGAVALGGCGVGSPDNEADCTHSPDYAAWREATTKHALGITVREGGGGGRFRTTDGRTWKRCNRTVYNGYDLSDIAVSGLKCTDGVGVMKALAEQVQRSEAAGEDCFPGYCMGEGDDPGPMSVAGYDCTAEDVGNASIFLLIDCRHGNRYVSATAADDE